MRDYASQTGVEGLHAPRLATQPILTSLFYAIEVAGIFTKDVQMLRRVSADEQSPLGNVD